MLKFIYKNSFRHKLRSILTIVGIAIAVVAFGLLRTVVTAWNSGVSAAAADRLVTRQAVSFILPLPYAYKDRIEKIPGVKLATANIWFQGVYKEKQNFFARIAVEPEDFKEMFPEYLISNEQLEAFAKERASCIIGSKLAEKYGFTIGDVIPIIGDIYPGNWEFTVRGIYTPRDKATDATQMFIQYPYIDERMKAEDPLRAGNLGWYSVKIANPAQSGEISQQIDNLFLNSPAETKTETEKAFQQGFVSSMGVVLNAMDYMSFIIIGIIMLVLGNTMIMSARERTREYAVLKTLGFTARQLVLFVFGESMFVSFLGAIVGVLITYPIVALFAKVFANSGFFPVFFIEPITLILAFSAAVLVGIVSALIPLRRVLSTRIVDGLRFIG